MKNIAVLGSTGSVGRATLSVIARHADLFRVVALCAHRSTEAVAAQVLEHGVPVAVIVDPDALEDVDDLPTAEWRTGAYASAPGPSGGADEIPEEDVPAHWPGALLGASASLVR